MKKIKISTLKPGARIGVVAPASPVNYSDQLQQAINKLCMHGYQVILGKTTVSSMDYLAGSDLIRQTDLEELWQDDTIEAIWCLRGGYGSLRLLPRLWYNLFAKQPKILIGFSDITALELGIWAETRLITFHGPVLTSLNSEFTTHQAFSVLNGLQTISDLPWPTPNLSNFYPIKKGKAQGIILGGNLTTICSLLGTRFLPDFDGAILFLEEIQEAAYRIDRLLTQLILSGVIQNCAAVLVGQCVPMGSQTESELIDVFKERLNLLNCPSAYGFPIGHIHDQWTIPQGVLGETDTVEGKLSLLESPWK